MFASWRRSKSFVSRRCSNFYFPAPISCLGDWFFIFACTSAVPCAAGFWVKHFELFGLLAKTVVRIRPGVQSG